MTNTHIHMKVSHRERCRRLVEGDDRHTTSIVEICLQVDHPNSVLETNEATRVTVLYIFKFKVLVCWKILHVRPVSHDRR